jgi:hypothetical protein
VAPIRKTSNCLRGTFAIAILIEIVPRSSLARLQDKGPQRGDREQSDEAKPSGRGWETSQLRHLQLWLVV